VHLVAGKAYRIHEGCLAINPDATYRLGGIEMDECVRSSGSHRSDDLVDRLDHAGLAVHGLKQ
jgi:hypothetical protein